MAPSPMTPSVTYSEKNPEECLNTGSIPGTLLHVRELGMYPLAMHFLDILTCRVEDVSAYKHHRNTSVLLTDLLSTESKQCQYVGTHDLRQLHHKSWD